MGNLENYIEKLDSIDMNIKIENKGLKITEDPLLLVDTVRKFLNKIKISGYKNMLEIGTGQGIVSILLSNIENINKIYAVEIQKELYEILKDNIIENRLTEKIIPINEDIKNIKGEYDFIISNPPYYKLNEGKLPADEMELISKYEIKLTLEELVGNIKRLLKNHGYFFIVIPNNRLNDIFNYIYLNKLSVISMNIKKYKKLDLIVIIGKKGGKYKSGIELNIIENKMEKR